MQFESYESDVGIVPQHNCDTNLFVDSSLMKENLQLLFSPLCLIADSIQSKFELSY